MYMMHQFWQLGIAKELGGGGMCLWVVILRPLINIEQVKNNKKKKRLYLNNKRSMSHIAHLRNQFKSMNTFERSYEFIYYKNGPVVQEEKTFKFCECTFAILLLSPNVKKCGLSIWTKLKSSLPRESFCLVWLKLAQWLYILEEDFQIFAIM